MVEQGQPPRVRRDREVHRPLGRCVSPRDLGGILLQRVLRVVDHQVGAGQELDVPRVLAVHAGGVAADIRMVARVRLVVGGVDDGDAVGLEPVAERRRRVVEVAGGDADGVELEHTLGQLVIADGRRQLAERHREVRAVHLAAQDLLAASGPSGAARTRPTRCRGRTAGAKNGKPWMWSQWVWVISRCPRIGPGSAVTMLLAQLVGAGAAVEHDQRARRPGPRRRRCCRRSGPWWGPAWGWSHGYPRSESACRPPLDQSATVAGLMVCHAAPVGEDFARCRPVVRACIAG